MVEMSFKLQLPFLCFFALGTIWHLKCLLCFSLRKTYVLSLRMKQQFNSGNYIFVHFEKGNKVEREKIMSLVFQVRLMRAVQHDLEL